MWWTCPVRIDSNIADEFGLLDAVEMILSDKDVEKYIRMGSSIRVDFDAKNDTDEHSGAHLHMESEACRINMNETICFNCKKLYKNKT